MSTFGGDEVSAVVLDVGSCWTRAGYAGEDTPKAVFPTSFGYLPGLKKPRSKLSTQGIDSDTLMADAEFQAVESSIGSSSKKAEKQPAIEQYVIGDGEINAWRENMEIKNPLQDGLVYDWDALEEIWEYTFKKMLRIKPNEHPLLITEAHWNTRQIREKLTELAFEKFNTLAFYVSKNPVLTAFASGRPTAIVLDCGASNTSVVPVYDGYVIRKASQRSPIAGDFISEQILYQLENQMNIQVNPHYLVSRKNFAEPEQPPSFTRHERPNTTASFHRFQQMRVIHEYKESVCQIYESAWNEGVIAGRPMKPFEFPDGYNASFGIERYRAPEVLFNPAEFAFQPNDPRVKQSIGIPRMIYNCLSHCDIDVRSTFLSNLVFTGGSTLFPGFHDRVIAELSPMVPGHRVKVHAPSNSVERKCSAWLGGSILASLGTFHQLWISRKEYNEQGRSIVEKKCE